jgi:Ca2+-binding EF-hand superfamily protein
LHFRPQLNCSKRPDVTLISFSMAFNQRGGGGGGGQTNELNQLREAFFNFDVDRDGWISTEELRVILMTKGSKFSAQEAAEFIQELDYDNDGYINYDEAAAWMLQEG